MRRLNGRQGLDFEAACARGRRDENDRPRDGWKLIRSFRVQTWLWEANGCTAHVWGGQLSPPWRYEVFHKTGPVTAGDALTLAAAMQDAEIYVLRADEAANPPNGDT